MEHGTTQKKMVLNYSAIINKNVRQNFFVFTLLIF